MKCGKVRPPFHPLRFSQPIIELDGYAIEHDGLCTTVC